MDPPSAAQTERAKQIKERFDEILKYHAIGGGNWLGQLLKTMSIVAIANMDKAKDAKYREEQVKKYYEFLGSPDFRRVGKKDAAFSVVLSFANLFGSFLEDVNDREQNSVHSMLFAPYNEDSLRDNVLPNTSSMVTRKRPAMPSSAQFETDISLPSAKARRSLSLGLRSNGNGRRSGDTADTLGDDDLPVSPLAAGLQFFANPDGDGVEQKRTAAVDEEEDAPLGQATPRKGARGAKKVVVCTTPRAPPKSAVKATTVKTEPGSTVKTPRRVSFGAADFDTTPLNMVVECAECGAKVKQGGLRRHMKGHEMEARAVAEPVAAAAPTPLSGLVLTKETQQTPRKKAPVVNIKLNEFGLEEESADDDEEDTTTAGEKELLAEWAAVMFEKPADCFKCHKSYPNYRTLSNHLYRAHHGLCGEHYIFMCTGCQKQFRSFHGTIGHIKVAIRKNQLECKNKISYLGDTIQAEADAGPTMLTVKREPVDPDEAAKDEQMEQKNGPIAPSL